MKTPIIASTDQIDPLIIKHTDWMVMSYYAEKSVIDFLIIKDLTITIQMTLLPRNFFFFGGVGVGGELHTHPIGIFNAKENFRIRSTEG